MYCNNCGKYGHNYGHCKNLITSYGVVAFRWNPELSAMQYLMICRKNTLGYMDFIRGKYMTNDHDYIYNMITQMTEFETKQILSGNFEYIWSMAFGCTEENVLLKVPDQVAPDQVAPDQKVPDQVAPDQVVPELKDDQIDNPEEDYDTLTEPALPESIIALNIEIDSILAIGGASQTVVPITLPVTVPSAPKPPTTLNHEMYVSQEKYRQLTNKLSENGIPLLSSLIKRSIESGNSWKEPEWGFPKGRRNYRESDYECAIREFCEETGFPLKSLKNIQNVVPFEEIFMGSNYKSYKHRYYLVNIPYEHSQNMSNFERAEVSKMEWKTYEECMRDIRPYNLEKKRIITNIHLGLKRYMFVCE